MAGLFRSPRAPVALAQPEEKEDTSAADAARSIAERIMKRRKGQPTILTGPLGVTGQPSTLKTVLG